jgi:hypothetical protein
MRSAILVIGLVACTLAAPGSRAQTYWRSTPACQPGYTLVEETCYRDVVRCCCKVVPDVKKKTKVVYDCKCEPYCVPKLACRKHQCPHCGACAGCDCECPPKCGKIRNKTILMKKTITHECPGWKCVVEKVCERVPYKVYRMVPCGTTTPRCAPAAPALLPAEAPGPLIPVSATLPLAPQSRQVPAVPVSVADTGAEPEAQPAPLPLPVGLTEDEPLMLPQTLPVPRATTEPGAARDQPGPAP